MLAAALSRLLSAWFVFLLPSYATFKALSHRPLSDSELHKWSVYWTVIGALLAVESVAEWLVSWLPFYWELKTVFFLFLSLPQTEGTSYIYSAYLHPFFSHNEAGFDACIVRFQQNTLTFVHEKFTGLWNSIWSISAEKNPQSHASSFATSPQSPWVLPADTWRSATNILHSTTKTSFTPSTSRPLNSRSGSSHSSSHSQQEAAGQQSIPFPVPQHYH